MNKLSHSSTQSQNFIDLTITFTISLILLIATALSGCTVAAPAPPKDPVPIISTEDIYFQTNEFYNDPIAIVSDNTITIKNIKNRLTSSSETLSVSIVDVVHEGSQPAYVAEPSTFTIPAHELNPDGISSTNIEISQVIAILPTALNRRGLSRRILYKVAVDLKGLVQVKLSGNVETTFLTEDIEIANDVTLKPCANYPPTLTVLEGGLPIDTFQPSISKNIDPYRPGVTRASLRLMENNNLYSEFIFNVNVQSCLTDQDISFAFLGPHAHLYDTLGAAASISSNAITISNLKNRHDLGDLASTHPLSQIDANLHVTIQDQDNAPDFRVSSGSLLTLDSNVLNPPGITAGTYPIPQKIIINNPTLTEGLTYNFQLKFTSLRVLKLSGNVYDTFFYEDVFLPDITIKPCRKTYAPTATVFSGDTILSTITTTVSSPSIPINPYEVGVAAQGTAILNENGTPIETYSFDIVVPPCTLKSPTGNIVGMTGVRGNLNAIGSAANPWNIDSDLRLDLASRMITDSNADYGNHHYTLSENIDLGVAKAPWSESSTHSQPRITGFTPIDNFTGTLNCSSHVIDNLYIHKNNNHAGFFKKINSDGVLEYCRLNNPKITGTTDIGSLVATLAGSVKNSYVTGGEISSINTPLYANIRMGGLVGSNSGTITHSYASGIAITFDVGNRKSIGGLVGINSGTIEESYAANDINGDGSYLGGLVGLMNRGKIKRFYATGNISGDNNFSIGGLIGYVSNGTIEEAYATGDITVNINSTNTGGLIGYIQSAMIEKSYANGTVSGFSRVGGLVGMILSGTIEKSYASGNIDGEEYLGGLVGISDINATLKNSYATGAVTTSRNLAGSLIGEGRGVVVNSYGRGRVSGMSSLGGLLASNSASTRVTTSYWDKTTTGQDSSAAGIGRTTAQMQVAAPIPAIITLPLPTNAVYVDWDTATWRFAAGEYPKLIEVVCAHRQTNPNINC
ncbi:hypothetical protein COTS27_00994 [Spirochaetota bacterium]|nr:hypothetical protein COTS27_00994 [Spirochaetota bacterium]